MPRRAGESAIGGDERSVQCFGKRHIGCVERTHVRTELPHSREEPRVRVAPDAHLAEVRERFLGTDDRDGAADRESAQRVSHFDVQQMWGVEGLGRSSKAGCDPLEGAGREQIVDRSRRVDDDQVAFR